MRYKYTLQEGIRNQVEWTLSHYHEDKRQMEQYKRDMMPSGVASYGESVGGHSGPGNPTAATVERIITSPYLITTERNIRAVEMALKPCDETDRRLVDLVYWQERYNVVGAGEIVGLKATGAYDRINRILVRLALEMGLIYI